MKNYKEKYLKYKNKYLRMKESLNNNITGGVLLLNNDRDELFEDDMFELSLYNLLYRMD